jgi:hypothetical protein
MPFKNPFSKDDDSKQTKTEAESLVEKLGPVFAEVLKPLADNVKILSDKFTALESEASRSAEEEASRARAAANAEKSPEERSSEELRNTRLAVALTNARITEEGIMRSVAQQWPHLVPKIQMCINNIPTNEKVAPDYPRRCQNAVTLIVGEEAINGGLRYDARHSKYFLEDTSSSGGGGAVDPLNSPDLTWQDPNNPNKVLTGRQQLSKLKIDPEDFIKGPVGKEIM